MFASPLWNYLRDSRAGRALLESRSGLILRGWSMYHRHPDKRDTLGGVLNGQEFRRRIVDAIFQTWQPQMIVETGTYKGVTTEFFAGFGIPVHSVEANPLYYGMARARLHKHRNVRLSLGDSREFLRQLVRRAGASRQRIFFYLDAHWEESLPLAEELALILEAASNSIIMIDDFAVADDSDYGYDDYGPGRALTWEYVEPLARQYGLQALSPALPGSQETGYRRGCIVLNSHPELEANLLELGVLRRAPEQSTAITK